MAVVMADSTAKATAKGTAKAKIDSGVAVAIMTTIQQWQSIDGRLLIIIWSASLGGARE
jgi:hypothetical protein